MKLTKILEAEYGNVLFGDPKNNPKFAKLQGAKPGSEPDTEGEKKLYNALQKWVVKPEDAVTDLFAFKKQLKAVMNDYPEVVKPSTPDGTLLFRGLRNLSPDLVNQINKADPKDWIKSGKWYLLKTPVEYTPRRVVQSWTPNYKVAEEGFSGQAILITRQNSEFIFNQNVFKILYDENEKEILHFDTQYSGNVYVAVAEYPGASWIKQFYKRYKEIPKVSSSTGGLKNLSSTLKEIGDSQKGYDYQTDWGDEGEILRNGAHNEYSFKDKNGIEYAVDIFNKGGYLAVEFSIPYDSPTGDHGVSNFGDQYKVMGTIVNIIKDIVDSDEEGRIKGIEYDPTFKSSEAGNSRIPKISHQSKEGEPVNKRDKLYRTYIQNAFKNKKIEFSNKGGTIIAHFPKK